MTLLAARSASQQEGAAVLGRSTALEKEYLRLTSMPTLDAVRPPAVLLRALRMVQQHWLQVPCTLLLRPCMHLTANHAEGQL